VKVAPDTYLIPDLAAAEPRTFVPVNSVVILGEEPITSFNASLTQVSNCARSRACT
jgi:hypothetical protein